MGSNRMDRTSAMQAEHNRIAAPPETIDDDPLVSTLMTPGITAITPDAPLIIALRLMASGDVRHLPVLEGRRCIGVVLETDLVRAVAVGAPVELGPLARPVPTVPITCRRSVAARTLLDGDVDAVLVTAEGQLVGIVTTTDLVRSLAAGPHPRPDDR
jgi:CBS domain-containing protein